MSTTAAKPWEQLFPPPAPGVRSVTMPLRLLRKRGEPLLLLPAAGPAADAALELYPAQSWKAKLARGGLHLMRKVGALPGTSPVELRVALESPFAQFLCPPGRRVEDLSFALLLGNPSAAGRRFVLLVFDREGSPMRAIKAGAGSERALELIRNEAAFRKAVPAPVLSAPEIQALFAQDGIAALAMDYASGHTPRFDEINPVSALMESWLSRERPVRFADLPAARRLAAGARPDAATQRAVEQLSRLTVHTAIHHGDFAPWNIRVNPATQHWTVLDWERGELAGPPAWDWFHFILQPEVLVHRARPAAIVAKLEKFLHSPAFVRYATHAGVQSSVDTLLLGYALYCRDITRQTEGMPTIEALVKLLGKKA